MKNIRKKLKRFGVLIIVALLIIIGLLSYFFIANAPILKGDVIRQVEYKEKLTLDIYLPTQLVYKKSPVVIFIHGGAWITGRKEIININRFNDAVNKLRAKGYSVISPSYSLAKQGKSPFPHCIIDAVDAVRWVESNADTYNFDLHNVGLIGESAGAHIAMMIAYAVPSGISDTFSMNMEINYLVDIYGPTDLEKLYHMQSIEKLNNHLGKLPESLRKQLDIAQHLFGFDPEQDPVKAKLFQQKYSPINYVTSSSPPTLIIHGDADQIVPVDQSILLHKKLDSLNVVHETHILNNVNHGFRGTTSIQKDEIQQWVVDFIEHQYNIY